MLRRRHIVITSALSLALSGACESGGTPESQPAPESQPGASAVPKATQPGEGCTYSYDPAATKLTWKAFKLTERVGVEGSFKDIKVTGAASAEDPEGVFAKLAFEIDTTGVDSQNPERDQKLRDSLFGKLQDGATIRGSVKRIEAGTGVVALQLGGVTKDVALDYAVSPEGVLSASGKLDLTDFNGADAVAALNKACEEQHTGADKQSKLWPDVELSITTTLKKTCK